MPKGDGGLSCQGCALIGAALGGGVYAASRYGWLPAWLGNAVGIGALAVGVIALVAGVAGMIGLSRLNQ